MDVIKAHSILIIPKQIEDLSLWYASIALGKVLESSDKSYQIYINEDLSKLLLEILEPSAPLFNTLKYNDLQITVGNVNGKVEKLSWEQNEESLSIKVSLDQDIANTPEVKISPVGNIFDLKIFLGMERTEAESIPMIVKHKLMNGTSVFLNETSEMNHAEQVYDFLLRAKLPIGKEPAELLLKSLYLSTENFTKKTNPETFFLASKLMSSSEETPTIKEKKKTEKPVKSKEIEEEVTKAEEPETVLPAPVMAEEKIPVKVEEKAEVTSPVSTSPAPTAPVENTVTESTPQVTVPEELPSDYDPLAPAFEIPQPLKLENNQPPVKQVVNTPLPEAE